jgi:hypothetical protein
LAQKAKEFLEWYNISYKGASVKKAFRFKCHKCEATFADSECAEKGEARKCPRCGAGDNQLEYKNASVMIHSAGKPCGGIGPTSDDRRMVNCPKCLGAKGASAVTVRCSHGEGACIGASCTHGEKCGCRDTVKEQPERPRITASEECPKGGKHEFKYYSGALGYESEKCTKCGKDTADEWGKTPEGRGKKASLTKKADDWADNNAFKPREEIEHQTNPNPVHFEQEEDAREVKVALSQIQDFLQAVVPHVIQYAMEKQDKEVLKALGHLGTVIREARKTWRLAREQEESEYSRTYLAHPSTDLSDMIQ